MKCTDTTSPVVVSTATAPLWVKKTCAQSFDWGATKKGGGERESGGEGNIENKHETRKKHQNMF